jgi:hypothetical protein
MEFNPIIKYLSNIENPLLLKKQRLANLENNENLELKENELKLQNLQIKLDYFNSKFLKKTNQLKISYQNNVIKSSRIYF